MKALVVLAAVVSAMAFAIPAAVGSSSRVGGHEARRSAGAENGALVTGVRVGGLHASIPTPVSADALAPPRPHALDWSVAAGSLLVLVIGLLVAARRNHEELVI
jgi:hypothetical protein